MTPLPSPGTALRARELRLFSPNSQLRLVCRLHPVTAGAAASMRRRDSQRTDRHGASEKRRELFTYYCFYKARNSDNEFSLRF